MNWQKQEQSWIKGLWPKQEQRPCSMKREEVYATLQYAASFHCSVEELKPRPKESGRSWTRKESRRNIERSGVEANRYRCMRCGKSSKQMKMPEKCAVDMRYYVCPKDVKKMLMQQARSVYWKKWAAKHEREELNEWTWVELALALLRKKTNEEWTDRHRSTARKLVLEGGWVQKKLFDIGWSDESECQAFHKEKGTEKHRLYHCPDWYEVRWEIPEAFRKWEQKAKTSKKEWKWQRVL